MSNPTLNTNTVPPSSGCAPAMPAYDRSAVTTGLIHLGPGAFHRAHQAVYTDDILHLDPRWGICGVSLRSSGVRDALRGQDYLYTLVMLDDKPAYRIVGSIKNMLVAAEDPQLVVGRLANAEVHVVTMTITEKGYCATSDGDLDTNDRTIQHDLAHPHTPVSAIGFLVEGLSRRRQDGNAPFVPVSCDNWAENGRRLRKVVLQYAAEIDPDLAEWIRGEVPFPCTMVDSITPATDDALRHRVASATGMTDESPVQREAFSEWILADEFLGSRPPWESAGAVFSNNVRAHETAKLRLLNGCHSALAYLGLLIGDVTVAESMKNERVVSYLRRMMREEICPTIDVSDEFDLAVYCESLMARFANPNVQYLLAQIAWDGSQKIPYRLLHTIEDNLKVGRSVRLLSLAVAAWMMFVRRATSESLPHTDPLKETLSSVAQACTGDPDGDVGAFLALRQVFPRELAHLTGFFDNLVAAYRLLESSTRPGVMRALAST